MAADPQVVNACVQTFLQTPVIKRVTDFLDRVQAPSVNAGTRTAVKPKSSAADLDPAALAEATKQYCLAQAEEGHIVSYEEGRTKVLKKLAEGGKLPKAVMLAHESATGDIAQYSQRQQAAVFLE